MKLKVLNPDNTGLTKEMIALREKRMKQIARPDTQIDMEVQEKTKICVDSALDVAVTSLEELSFLLLNRYYPDLILLAS